MYAYYDRCIASSGGIVGLKCKQSDFHIKLSEEILIVSSYPTYTTPTYYYSTIKLN
jgi:hypothetical protein